MCLFVYVCACVSVRARVWYVCVTYQRQTEDVDDEVGGPLILLAHRLRFSSHITCKYMYYNHNSDLRSLFWTPTALILIFSDSAKCVAVNWPRSIIVDLSVPNLSMIRVWDPAITMSAPQ